MFPSSGLFAAVECPFSNNGLCDRPHCLYKHTTSMVGFAGAQNVTPKGDTGTTESDRGKDVCLQELEWINKEIETMRHQVEQEQKQLSNYQTVQADKGDIASSSHLQQSKTCRSIDTGAYESLPCSYLEDRKYVVDSSKPRTDLEYDPLSNFSSDLSSYSSSRREQKLKNTQSLKKARTVGPCDQKSSTQAQLSRLASPEPLDDWMEDDVLIIDIPPSPQKKEGQGMKCSLAVTDKSQGHEKKGGEAPSILLDSPLQCSKPELLDIEEIDDKCAETKNLANLHESRELNAQSVLPHCQKPITKNPGPLLSKPGNCAEQVEKNSSSQTQTKLAESSESNQYLEKDNGRVIVIDSTSEDEINYSDIDVSDSDPMEECYRIFMEENEQKRTEELPDARPPPHKRKVKHCESTKDKVPHDVRQRYVNMFTEEFLKTTANVNEAFEKALAEERSVYNRSVNKLKYLSVAVNALKKLKNQCVAAKTESSDDLALYDDMKEYMLSVEKLIENNYPVRHPEKPGCAILFVDNKKGTGDPLKRICCRCGATYSVSPTGKHTRKEECTYHYGKGVTKRVPGGVETRYSCCEGVMGTPGCQVYKLHVHDSVSLNGFVSTVPRHPSNTSCPGLYALDCEMCYTIHGLELSRVTLVNSRLQVIYDTFVSPDNEVIDYNTRFSGISEEDVKGNHTSLREVQDKLLSFINADTILIGHSLETDLCALKLLHGTVVDTSVVFPHHLGPPYKLTLTSITAEHLRRIIQESVCGHDTAEDASACMELMLWKLKEDGKLKK
uniref:Zgc:152968 n=1 Tax=Takifugu rubripes TaxID=31033 RepID=A0A3B5K017_TAKRU